MKFLKYDELPEFMKCEEVKHYHEILEKKKGQLVIKRLIDIVGGLVGTIVLSPIMLIVAILIKIESKGPALFKQVRVTQYGKEFKILKFRTMVVNAEKLGAQVTSKNDPRVTKTGKFLRKYRLDELPQIINILKGELSFVGTRPEVPKYVSRYSKEMLATLLLPAGVTSKASIEFKDEEKLLNGVENVDETYVNIVLKEKMKFNLQSIEEFSNSEEIKTMINTVLAVMKKDKSAVYMQKNNDNGVSM